MDNNSCFADAIVIKFHPWIERDEGKYHT